MREIKFRGYEKGEGYYSTKFTMQHLTDLIGDPDCTVEQFTGLKDKNGVDIYEGDIVTHAKETNILSKCTMVGGYEVIWDELEARFILGKGDVWGMIYKAYEVIGNIHEK